MRRAGGGLRGAEPRGRSGSGLRVCMLVHKPYVHDTRVRRYAEALAAEGSRVDVICTRNPEPAAQPCTTDGVSVHVIPCAHEAGGRLSQIGEYAMALPMYAARLLALQLRHRYDVIHVHNMPDFLVLAAALPRLLGAKVVLDLHDPMPEFYMSKYGLQGDRLALRLLRWQERASARLADWIVTANTRFGENLARRGLPRDRITVITNCPDLTVFDRAAWRRPGKADGAPFTLIYPGTIAPRYGLEVAVRALPQLAANISELRLLIMGTENGHARELLALATRLGVAALISFTGTLPPAEVARHVGEADVGIYPALPDPHMSIAIPSKVLEYAAMGVPIVASRLPVLQDLFDETAVTFFEPGSVEQFAAGVLALRQQPGLAEERIRNADRAMARWKSWSDERGVYLELVDRLSSPGRGRADREAIG